MTVLCTVLSSCATLFSGTKDRIVINTTPPGADVYIDGELKGKSGQDIILKRKMRNTRNVNVRKEGYEELNFGIDQKVTPAYWINIAFFLPGILPGLIGCGVDMITGACNKPKETEFNRVLTEKGK